MRIHIDHKKLTDSPFSKGFEEIFNYKNEDIQDLIQDLINGNPTCYLVSGYRGAGKSSFIHKIKMTIDDDVNNKENTNQQILFVNSNFSRFHNKTHFLRKIIRELYWKVSSNSKYQKFKSENSKKELPILLDSLYEKTFFEVTASQNYNISEKSEIKSKINVIPFLLGFVSLLFLSLNMVAGWIEFDIVMYIIGMIASGASVAKEILKITYTESYSEANSVDLNRKTLYDDEIADYHFFSLLSLLEKEDFKIVFVFDELDKVDEEEVESLLKEMKPYLVSGAASFIVIAGQPFFYKFFISKSIDDGILSTLFSRTVHIPLLSREMFHELFEKIALNRNELDNDQKKLLSHFVDQLIFESKRVPRAFIGNIRHLLTWEDNKAYLEIKVDLNDVVIYSKLLNIIDKIYDEEIAVDNFKDGAINDYFVMNLFIICHIILSNKRINFTKEDILQ